MSAIDGKAITQKNGWKLRAKFDLFARILLFKFETKLRFAWSMSCNLKSIQIEKFRFINIRQRLKTKTQTNRRVA